MSDIFGFVVIEDQTNPNGIQHLTERGLRSQIVLNTNSYEGRGIGLYLFKRICENENIAQKIIIGTDYKAFEGYMYAPFYCRDDI